MATPFATRRSKDLYKFTWTEVARDFQALSELGAMFQKGAFFNRMKVGGDFSIRATFEGPASFSGTDIAGNFTAMAKFRNKEKEVSFSHMKVGGDASFNHAAFEGPVDLRYAGFGLLNVSNASWPKAPAQFHVEGMSYKTIVAEEPKSHKRLVELADQPAYAADMYRSLEDFFVRKGYRGDADEAFIAGKRRERREYLHGSEWVGSWMLDLLVGYGRRPWQAGIPCAVFIAIGCILFSPKKMEPQNPTEAPRVYSRFSVQP